MSVSIGLDISARTVDMVCRDDNRNGRVQTFPQDPKGHARLIEQLCKLEPDHIVMEATGVYYLDLAVALAEAQLPISVINPKSFRRFAELTLTNSKTDGLDSALLAEYGQRMKPFLWTPPAANCLELRDIARQINRLIGSRTQAKNRLHALRAKRQTPSLLIDDEQEGIATIERRIERLKQAAVSLIKQDQTLSPAFACLGSAKGIGTASAIALLGELCVLPSHMKASQVSRHAGLDVRLYQSGTSVNGPGQLSKTGNAYLRAALYMPAMSTIRHEPLASAFYQALVGRGKKGKQALCAVMRKYLMGVWACLQNNTAFDPSLLFSDIHQRA